VNKGKIEITNEAQELQHLTNAAVLDEGHKRKTQEVQHNFIERKDSKEGKSKSRQATRRRRASAIAYTFQPGLDEWERELQVRLSVASGRKTWPYEDWSTEAIHSNLVSESEQLPH
jgi:hypothetical protein